MDSFEFNNIKADKAQAMRNYNSQKMLKKLELFTALAFLAWSSYNYIPVATKVSAAFLLQNAAVFGQPLYVFISINLLIAAISVLSSSQKPTTKAHVLYDEYVTNITPRRRFTADTQIFRVDNNEVNISPVEQNQVGATAKDCGPVCWVGRAVTHEEKDYRRTRSEKMMVRRTESEVKKGRRSCEMDDLSSEEFRMTIESFIAAQKKTLFQENTLDKNIAVPFTITAIELTEDHL